MAGEARPKNNPQKHKHKERSVGKCGHHHYFDHRCRRRWSPTETVAPSIAAPNTCLRRIPPATRAAAMTSTTMAAAILVKPDRRRLLCRSKRTTRARSWRNCGAVETRRRNAWQPGGRRTRIIAMGQRRGSAPRSQEWEYPTPSREIRTYWRLILIHGAKCVSGGS